MWNSLSAALSVKWFYQLLSYQFRVNFSLCSTTSEIVLEIAIFSLSSQIAKGNVLIDPHFFYVRALTLNEKVISIICCLICTFIGSYYVNDITSYKANKMPVIIAQRTIIIMLIFLIAFNFKHYNLLRLYE